MPRLVREDAVTVALSVEPVSVPAAAVTVILPVPSKLVPLIVRGVLNAAAYVAVVALVAEVAVEALPVRAPTNVVAVAVVKVAAAGVAMPIGVPSIPDTNFALPVNAGFAT